MKWRRRHTQHLHWFCIQEAGDIKGIEKLFLETQEVWNDYGERKEKRRMVELAEQLTGIRLLSPQEAEEAEEMEKKIK